jgi:magnesium transporter
MLIQLRHAVFPLIESLSKILKEDSELIDHCTHVYLQDACDPFIQIIETVTSYREIKSDLRDMYQIMQVPTIVFSIFIPIPFVDGIYGMNYKNIPELSCN